MKENCILKKFAAVVEKFPDKIALYYKIGDDEIRLTYRELMDKVDAYGLLLEKELAKLGEKPIKVGLIGSNKLEIIICQLAVQKAGGVFVPLDHSAPKDKLKQQVTNSNISLLLIADKPGLDLFEAPAEIKAEGVEVVNVDDLKKKI